MNQGPTLKGPNPMEWPLFPDGPPPSVTLTGAQAQRVLRELAIGLCSTTTLRWLAEQLTPEHLASPWSPPGEVERLLVELQREAREELDAYNRGYVAGHESGYDAAVRRYELQQQEQAEEAEKARRSRHQPRPGPPQLKLV